MNRLNTLLIVFLFIAISTAFTGCGLVGVLGTNKTEISSNMGEELPEWLTAAHRVQAVPQPVREPEEDDSSQNTGTIPITGQPVSPQPAPTQPAPQPAPQPSGTPRWQQPGTMEYIAKHQLDQLVFSYKKLNTDIAKFEGEEEQLKALKKDREERYETLSEIAGSIGLSLDREYGIKPPPTDATETTDSTWFYDQDHSPSGFGN